jgi:hypothetical protein
MERGRHRPDSLSRHPDLRDTARAMSQENVEIVRRADQRADDHPRSSVNHQSDKATRRFP